jgi:hypothetical protein
MAYNAFLGRLALTKMMEIPYYAYLVLKMSGPNCIISVKGDVKHAYDCDRESCETADGLMASAELQELKKALAEPHMDPFMPEAKVSHLVSRPKLNTYLYVCQDQVLHIKR